MEWIGNAMDSISEACMYAYWGYRSFGLGQQALEIEQQVSEHLSKGSLSTKEGLSLAARTTTLACDIMVLRSDWQGSKLEKRIEQLHLTNQETTPSDMPALKQELNKCQMHSIIYQTGAVASCITHKVCDNKPVMDRDVTSRLGTIVYTVGQATQQPYLEKGGAVLTATVSMDKLKERFHHWYSRHAKDAPPIEYSINYMSIPSNYEYNRIFQQFICPLTKKPIRYPVTISNPLGNDYHFERKAILNWLRTHNTNPITNSPLFVHELRENLQMRQIIETEIKRLKILM